MEQKSLKPEKLSFTHTRNKLLACRRFSAPLGVVSVTSGVTRKRLPGNGRPREPDVAPRWHARFTLRWSNRVFGGRLGRGSREEDVLGGGRGRDRTERRRGVAHWGTLKASQSESHCFGHETRFLPLPRGADVMATSICFLTTNMDSNQHKQINGQI